MSACRAARPGGAVHRRLRGKRRAEPRAPGAGDACDDEALPDGELRPEGGGFGGVGVVFAIDSSSV